MATGNWIKGMVAGFVATVVLSALMLMKEMIGVMPELNLRDHTPRKESTFLKRAANNRKRIELFVCSGPSEGE